jgi:hypothetical protein
MHLRRAVGTIAVSTPWACGLDRTGLGPIPEASACCPRLLVPEFVLPWIRFPTMPCARESERIYIIDVSSVAARRAHAL